ILSFYTCHILSVHPIYTMHSIIQNRKSFFHYNIVFQSQKVPYFLRLIVRNKLSRFFYQVYLRKNYHSFHCKPSIQIIFCFLILLTLIFQMTFFFFLFLIYKKKIYFSFKKILKKFFFFPFFYF